jgi:hypothetical protein
VFTRVGHVLLILALLGATGGHWALLQTFAWANMLAANLQTDSARDAIAKTFDGGHPCKMCKGIAAGKQAEKKAELPLQIKKMEFVNERPAAIMIASPHFPSIPATLAELHGISHRPSVPPPRGLAA